VILGCIQSKWTRDRKHTEEAEKATDFQRRRSERKLVPGGFPK